MKWADFPDSKNSWEPSSILEDIDVREYIKASEDASCIPCPVQEALGCGFFYQTHKPGVLVDHLNRSHIHLLTHPVAINSVLEQVTALRHCHSCAVFYPSSSSAHNACRASVTEVADGNVSALPSGIRVTAVQGSVANGVVSFGNRSFKTRDCGSIVQVSVSMSHSNCCFYLACTEGDQAAAWGLKCKLATRANEIARLRGRTGINFKGRSTMAEEEVALAYAGRVSNRCCFHHRGPSPPPLLPPRDQYWKHPYRPCHALWATLQCTPPRLAAHPPWPIWKVGRC